MTEKSASSPEGATIPTFGEAPVGAVLGTIAAVMSSIGTTLIGALMLLIVADVVGRNFFDAPITGVAEIAGRSVVAIVFLQVSAAILQERLTRADFLLRRLRDAAPRVSRALEVAFDIIGGTVFAVILWASFPKLVDAWTGSEFFGVQGVFTIPTWPFRLTTVAGATMASLAAFYCAAITIRRMRQQA